MKSSINAHKEKSKDSFMNTVAFSDGMGEVYSDSDHFNKCLKSISSDDIFSNAVSISPKYPITNFLL